MVTSFVKSMTNCLKIFIFFIYLEITSVFGQDRSLICGATYCDGGNSVVYKACCGTDNGQCCNRVQAWFIILIVLIILGVILCVGAIFFVRFRMVRTREEERRYDDVASYDNSYRIACDRNGFGAYENSFQTADMGYPRPNQSSPPSYRNYEYRY